MVLIFFKGAEIDLKDANGQTAVDVAHGWLAGDLQKLAVQRGNVVKLNKFGENPDLNLKNRSTVSENAQKAEIQRNLEISESANVIVRVKNGKIREISYFSADSVKIVTQKAAAAFGMSEVDVSLFVKKNGVFTPLNKDERMVNFIYLFIVFFFFLPFFRTLTLKKTKCFSSLHRGLRATSRWLIARKCIV
jgi:hypothetical protein